LNKRRLLNDFLQRIVRDFTGLPLAHVAGGPGFRDVLRCPTSIAATMNAFQPGPFRAFRALQEDIMNRLPFVLAAVLALGISSPLLAQTAAARQGKPPKMVAAAPTEIINLNTATVAQLGSLPGIGAKTADLIVQYRQKNGPFKKVEEIMNVKGVGEKSFLKLKSRIVVTAPKAGE
jgi:competence protein ComEA